jgi:Root hair defective 3 GTP-binding protein (RHD3)
MTLLDCFDLDFIALPHMNRRNELVFRQAVEELRMRFVDPGRSDYLLRQVYRPTVPADGLELYMRNIWVRTKNRFRRVRLN